MILDDYHYYAKDHPLTDNHYYYYPKDYHILYDELDCIICTDDTSAENRGFHEKMHFLPTVHLCVRHLSGELL